MPGALASQCWTPLLETPVPNTIDRCREFRKKTGKLGAHRHPTTRGLKREKKGETETRKKGSAVTPTSLLVSNVIYLPCTRIKILHYCATMLPRRALLPNGDLQLGSAGNVWWYERLWASFFLFHLSVCFSFCLFLSWKRRTPPSSTTRRVSR